jgi:formate/nitrite transporter FocA (FNT family)
MLLEIAKPMALLLCMVSLCAVFYTAFLVPASGLEQRIWDSLILLSLAAGICLASGLIFREEVHTARDEAHDSAPLTRDPLTRTLPIQMFCWAAGLILVLFVASWYLETYCIFYKDVRPL